MDWRNFGSGLSEKMKVKVEWAYYLVDVRLGFKREGKWKSYCQWPWNLQPVTQNFWNAIFSLNIYVVFFWAWKIPILIPRLAINIRYSEFHGFQACTPAYLFDRGEPTFGKFRFYCWFVENIFNPGVNAPGWEEGAI